MKDMHMKVSRYNGLMVTMHWLLAIMLVITWMLGTFVLQELPNNMEKHGPIKVHMIVGGVIALLMLVRLIVKFITVQPEKQTTGNRFLDWAAQLTHYFLYLIVFAMWGSGVGLSITAGIPDVIFDGVGTLPESFKVYEFRHLHGFLAVLMGLGVALHAAGAFYHHFVLKDDLIKRMWLSKNEKHIS